MASWRWTAISAVLALLPLARGRVERVFPTTQDVPLSVWERVGQPALPPRIVAELASPHQRTQLVGLEPGYVERSSLVKEAFKTGSLVKSRWSWYFRSHEQSLTPLRCAAKTIELGASPPECEHSSGDWLCGMGSPSPRCTLVEVGVAGGGSIQMWADWLGPATTVNGIDIGDVSHLPFLRDNVRIHRGDQGNPSLLRDLLATLAPIDALIDDGGHAVPQQIVTMREGLSFLRPGGVVVIEDTHTSYFADVEVTEFGRVQVASVPTTAKQCSYVFGWDHPTVPKARIPSLKGGDVPGTFVDVAKCLATVLQTERALEPMHTHWAVWNDPVGNRGLIEREFEAFPFWGLPPSFVAWFQRSVESVRVVDSIVSITRRRG
jgi:hypothetical protein